MTVRTPAEHVCRIFARIAWMKCQINGKLKLYLNIRRSPNVFACDSVLVSCQSCNSRTIRIRLGNFGFGLDENVNRRRPHICRVHTFPKKKKKLKHNENVKWSKMKCHRLSDLTAVVGACIPCSLGISIIKLKWVTTYDNKYCLHDDDDDEVLINSRSLCTFAHYIIIIIILGAESECEIEKEIANRECDVRRIYWIWSEHNPKSNIREISECDLMLFITFWGKLYFRRGRESVPHEMHITLTPKNEQSFWRMDNTLYTLGTHYIAPTSMRSFSLHSTKWKNERSNGSEHNCSDIHLRLVHTPLSLSLRPSSQCPAPSIHILGEQNH